MLLTLHLPLKNNSTADGKGRKKAGTGCMRPTWLKWLWPRAAGTSTRWWQVPVSGDYSNVLLPKTAAVAFPKPGISHLCPTQWTCYKPVFGKAKLSTQILYTDLKTILSSMCKMNQFFAVSSHTPLPASDTVINLYEIHTVSSSRLCWALTQPACDRETHRTSATNHGWGRKLETMKTHRNITPQAVK